MIPTAFLQLDIPLMLNGSSPLAALNNGSPASTTDPFAQLLKTSSEADSLVQSHESGPSVVDSAIYAEFSSQLALAAEASTALVALPSGTSLSISPSPQLQQFGTKPTSASLPAEHPPEGARPILPDARQLNINGAVVRFSQVQTPSLAKMVDSQIDLTEKHQPAQQPLSSGTTASGSTVMPEYIACDPDDIGGSKQPPSPEGSRTPGTEVIGALSIKAVMAADTNMADTPGTQLHVSSPATQAATASATPMPAPSAQHDLDQTIDRLVEARMAGRAGEVRLAVAHNEFGPVAIRLDPTASSLAANLSSADPDFVPAVNAALAERIQAERVVADRGLPVVEPVRAEATGTRGNDSAQNGRNSTDGGGSGTQHRSHPDSGPETRKWMRSGNQPAQNGLGSGSQRNSPSSGLYA